MPTFDTGLQSFDNPLTMTGISRVSLYAELLLANGVMKGKRLFEV